MSQSYSLCQHVVAVTAALVENKVLRHELSVITVLATDEAVAAAVGLSLAHRIYPDHSGWTNHHSAAHPHTDSPDPQHFLAAMLAIHEQNGPKLFAFAIDAIDQQTAEDMLFDLADFSFPVSKGWFHHLVIVRPTI